MDRTVYHCKTIIDAIYLLERYHKLGYRWSTGISLITKNYWEEYKEEMCYEADHDRKRFTFADVEYYEAISEYIIPYYAPFSIRKLLEERKYGQNYYFLQ